MALTPGHLLSSVMLVPFSNPSHSKDWQYRAGAPVGKAPGAAGGRIRHMIVLFLPLSKLLCICILGI